MAEPLAADALALESDADGVLRVRDTRVTLDCLISAFHDGATPEEIAQRYPTVALADIYQIVAYYLRHTAELESYLARRQHEGEEVRRSHESAWPPHGIRERLLARRRR